ncbi:MAG: hypothetical protein KJ826_07390 [Proteobacteria bacterium]|nr:hypothetical protein [Pseudomonadota bacterium]MBU4036140.1 hypothetical protein [Pseudomonadota bacterium]
MTKERKATSDVQLSDDMSHVGELPRGLDFLETKAHLVMGESQGYDLCLLPLFWHVGGGRGLYCVVNKKGYKMRYGFNARTNGSVVLPDGLNAPIQDMMTYVE